MVSARWRNDSHVPTLIVHGGAGADPTEEPEELREGVAGAVEAGWQVLGRSGRALDAVEAACASSKITRASMPGAAPSSRPGAVEMDAPSWRATRSATVRSPASPSPEPHHPRRRIPDDGAILLRRRGSDRPGARPRRPALRSPRARHRAATTAARGRSAGHRRRGRHRPLRHHRRRHVHGAGRASSGARRRLAADRLRILRGEQAGRACRARGTREATIRVVLARRTLEILRTIDDPSRPHSSHQRSPRGGRAAADSSDRLEGACGVGALDPVHARGPSARRPRSGPPPL